MNVRSAPLLFSLLSLGLLGTALAQVGGTPAGTIISNQAFATYTDSAGNVIGDNEPPVASNTVTTTVLPIYRFLITPDGAGPSTPSAQNTKTAVGGEFVEFGYTVANQGNAADTIALSVTQATTGTAGDTFDLTGVQIFLDNDNDGIVEPTDGNGVVDPGEPAITSLANLASGTSAQVVVRGTVPAGVATGGIANVNLVGTGTANNGTANTDANNWARANTLSQPLLSLSQTAVPATESTVNPNSTITYTLSGSNTGGSSPFAVGNVINLDGALTDGILISEAIPDDLTYDGLLTGAFTYPGSITTTLVYSTNGGTLWTATEPANLEDVTNVGILLPFAAGTRLNGNTPTLSYTLSFGATVPADALADDFYLATGNIRYDRNGNGTSELASENFNSNTVRHDVAELNTLALGPDGFPAGDGTGSYTQGNPNIPADTATVTRAADSQSVESVNNGRTVTFRQSLQNTGTTDDTYDLTVASPTGFPGTVSFTDLAGNPLTGDELEIAAGDTEDFLVIITLPDDYVSAVPIDFTVTATSEKDGTASNTTTNTIEAVVEDDISGVTIDSSDGDTGTEVGNPITVPASPGTTVNVPLELTNTGNNNPDTFDLTGSTDDELPGTPTPVYFRDTDCDGAPDGVAITQITLDPGENVCLVAQVSVAPGTPAGSYDVTSTATSPTTGATSTITNTISVAVVEAFTFAPTPLAQSANPGQATVYQHVVTNNSNAPANVAFTVTGGDPAFTYEYSLDGVTYTADLATLTPLVTTGDTQDFYVRVTTPAGAADRATDGGLTVTATPTYNGTAGTAASVTDTTTVTVGRLTLTKTVDRAQARPGQNLTYTITATNAGTGALTNVQVYDALPDNTVDTPGFADTEFVSVAATASFAGNVLYSTDGGATWDDVAPTALGATGTFYVGVDTDGSDKVGS